jgi:hypothetical protein
MSFRSKICRIALFSAQRTKGSKMNAKRLLAYFIVFVVFSLVVAACGGGSSDGGGGGDKGVGASGGVGKISDNTWVGKLAESDAYIVIMKSGLEHLVFVTDGKDDITLWFGGTVGVAGAGVFYFQDQDLHAINAKIDGKNYTGLVTVATGRHLGFTATPAKDDAGLYRAKDATGESGWIVLDDGSVRGAKVDADGKFLQGLTTRGGTRWTDAATKP